MLQVDPIDDTWRSSIINYIETQKWKIYKLAVINIIKWSCKNPNSLFPVTLLFHAQFVFNYKCLKSYSLSTIQYPTFQICFNGKINQFIFAKPIEIPYLKLTNWYIVMDIAIYNVIINSHIRYKRALQRFTTIWGRTKLFHLLLHLLINTCFWCCSLFYILLRVESAM